MEYRALEYRFFYSHDAGVDVACEIVRLELPPALLRHEEGACPSLRGWVGFSLTAGLIFDSTRLID